MELATWAIACGRSRKIPGGIETRLLEMYVIRGQEIGIIHDLLQAIGLRREK
jgi:hypothetical protein